MTTDSYSSRDSTPVIFRHNKAGVDLVGAFAPVLRGLLLDVPG